MVRGAPASRVVRLAGRAAPEPVQAALAAAVGDGTIRVLLWLDVEEAWVDGGGARREPAPESDGRAATTVGRDGARVALIEHDAALAPGVLQAACEALADRIDAERTVAELLARVRALEATEQRLREVFEAIELMVVTMDLDARMTYVNPFTERLSGWSRDELLGANWFETFKSGRESFLERVRAGEFPTRDHSIIVLRDGGHRQIDWYNVRLRDDDGATIGVLGIGRDTTSEVAARRSLETAERRMRDVLETVQLLAAQIDLDGRIAYVNEYLVRLSGWAPDELVGRRWHDVFRTGSEREFERIRAGHVDPRNQTPFVLRSGDTREIDWYNVPLRDEAGRLVGVVGIGRDITDQLRAEREVREFAAEHAALERVATEVARGVADDAVFRLVAEQAGRLVGADGCTLLRFVEGERALIVANWSDVAADQVTPEGRVVPITAGPAMAATFRSGRPERADQGAGMAGRPNPTGSDEAIRSAVAAPVTVTKAMWGALVAWRVTDEPLAADTERRLGAFASLVGTAIANADARTALAASRKRIVAAADDARRRLERNLHDGAQQRFVSLSLALRLTLARLKTDPAEAEAELRRALEELATGLAELRELARGIHPAILTERGLRAAVEALVARSPVAVELGELPDRRLEPEVEAAAYYVVSEALTNVARYAGAHSARVSIELADDVVRVEVADDGCGGADAGRGSGLRGLADRVEATGGTLTVVSPPGRGTCVVATLPVAAAPADGLA